jgi:hypothetical protein
MDKTAQHRRRLAGANAVLATLGLLAMLLMPASTPTSLTAGSTDLEAPASAGLPDGSPVVPGDTLDGYTAAQPADVPQAAAAAAETASADDADAGALPVSTTPDHPDCGKGFTKIEAGSVAGFCVHSALDGPGPVLSTNVASNYKAAAPVCRGNGVNGPRIRMIYMYVEGQPNRSAQTVPQIKEIVNRMEAVFRETSKLQGREVGMRVYMPGCKVAVDTLMIGKEQGQPDDPGKMLGRVTSHLVRNGYDKSDTKYIVWLDAGNKGACGIAPGYTPLLERGMNPTPATSSNVGWQNRALYENGMGLFAETALIFRYGVPLLGEPGPFRQVPTCWGQGGTGARTEVHELIHNIGGVNIGSPNSNGFGHCVDDHDIMCYGERGVLTKPRCAVPVELLDCGADDYFNARPAAGSYLSTHWNTANSKFLGDAVIQDAIPAEIPRP